MKKKIFFKEILFKFQKLAIIKQKKHNNQEYSIRLKYKPKLNNFYKFSTTSKSL